MRLPRRSSVAACGGYDDMHTITRAPAPGAARLVVARGARGAVRSRLSATSRSDSSRSVERFSSLKKCSSAHGDLLRRIDLPGLEPLEQILDGQIEVHDLVGLLEEAVGDGLAHRHAGVARHQIVEALEVLDVERADDVDAGVEQLEHVLVALAVAAAGHVGVRHLVDDRDLRLARQDGVEVHLLDDDAAVLDLAGAAPPRARR